MSNGEVCCILGVCCPPGSPAQFSHLVEMIQQTKPHWSIDEVEAAAVRVLTTHNNFADVKSAIEGPEVV